MTWASVAPDVLDALFRIARATFPVNEVTVLDGPQVNNSALPDSLTIGWGNDANDMTAVEHRFGGGTAAIDPENDTFTVRCAVQCQSGSGSITPLRNRAYAMLGDFITAIREDEALQGLVMYMDIAEAALVLSPSTGASIARLSFVLNCRTQARF